MSHEEARYEYRSFTPMLGGLEERVRRAGGQPTPAGTRDSAEVYLLSRADKRYNFKIRDGRLELKILEARQGSLERWVPQPPLEFPIDDDVLAAALVRALELPSALPPGAGRSAAALAAAFRAIPDAAAIDVHKRREGFELDGCIAELVQVTIGNHTTRSICVEGVDPKRVQDLAVRLGLVDLPNVSYLAEVRAVQGWPPDQSPGETPQAGDPS